MIEQKGKYRREIEFTPAFDKKAEGFGIAAAEMRFLLHGEAGSVQFLLMTGWHTQTAQKNLEEAVNTKPGSACLLKALPADLGYHSYTPMYEGHESMGPCLYLEGKYCYYDGSGLNAYPVFQTLVEKGEEALWKELEEYYEYIFEGIPSKEGKQKFSRKISIGETKDETTTT